MLVCVSSHHLAHETAGAARTRSSLRPLIFSRVVRTTTRAPRAARTRTCVWANSFRDDALAADLRCAIAHRGILGLRVRSGACHWGARRADPLALPRNDGLAFRPS